MPGLLFPPQVGIINPGEFAPANSIELVIWVSVGGRGTLVGPIIGAVLVNFGKSWFTAVPFPTSWLFVLGGLFICVTLFLPRGLFGLTESLVSSVLVDASSIRSGIDAGGSGMTEPILYLDLVSVTFDGFRALNKLSLIVEKGELRAVIGPNGAGKTTMMDVITGKTRPDQE